MQQKEQPQQREPGAEELVSVFLGLAGDTHRLLFHHKSTKHLPHSACPVYSTYII